MSRPKRESPSLPRPYARLLAESEARRRIVPGLDGDVRLDPGVQPGAPGVRAPDEL